MASVSQFNRIPIPLLPLEIILRNMHFYELFHLTASSENSRRLAQRLDVHRISSLTVYVHRTFVLFSLLDERQELGFLIDTSIPRSEDTEVNAFDSLLFWKKKKKPSPVFRNFTFRFGGKKFSLFTIHENSWELISLAEDSEERRMDLIYTLIDFFTTTFHCEHVRLADMSADDNPLIPRQFGVFDYPRPLNFRTLTLFGEWLQYRHIEALSFVKLEVLSHRLTADDMYKLINKWLSGGYNQLELIEIQDWPKEEHEKVLDWEISPEVAHQLFSTRITVRREDGRSATVISIWQRFIFQVHPS